MVLLNTKRRFGELDCPPPENLRRKRVKALPPDDQTHGDLFEVRAPHFYGFVDSIEEAQTAVRVQRQHRWTPVMQQDLSDRDTFYHVLFDCVSAAWIHSLPDDSTQWPALYTVAQVASSCLVEVTLSAVHYNFINQRLRPVIGTLVPPLIEGTWWGLVIADLAQIDPQQPWLPVTVRLPEPGSTNPVTILWAEQEAQTALIDLVVPWKLTKLVRFSHGWVEQYGFGPDVPAYRGF